MRVLERQALPRRYDRGRTCFFHANPKAFRDAVKRLIFDVYAGKLHPRIAAGLAPLMHLQLRVLDKTDPEKRLARLERLLRESIEQH